MLTAFRRLWSDEEGQDLIEYSVLICLLAMASMVFFGVFSKPTEGIWTTMNSRIGVANKAAGS